MGLVQRFFKPGKSSFFLFGPRGTGKSTLINAYFKKALTINLLEADVFHDYSLHPEKLRETVHALSTPTVIIIDEIQKIPELLNEVHLLIEEKKKHQFVLTGSSARKLKRAGVNLLAGRALLHTLHPFMAAELGKGFSLENALRVGLIPLIQSANDAEKALKAYVSLYVQEEVLQEGLVRRITNFSRFLEAASFSHGQVLNVMNIARDCGIDRKSVEAYIQILEDLLLAFKVPMFTHRAKRTLSSHPKLYFFDAGVFRVLRPTGPIDSSDEINGPALEGIVAQHLRAWNAYGTQNHNLFFWRTRSGVEVDFVVYGPKILCAIEVKNTKILRPEDFNSLLAFKDDYPAADLVMLYRGKDRFKRNNVLCCPCDDYLRSLVPGQPLVN